MDKVKLKFGWIDLDVKVTTAVEAESKDTELKTVCTGKPGAPSHAPVRVNGIMRCSNPECAREEKSYHPFPRGRDNGDGTFTIPSAEDMEGAKVDRALVETIDLTASPVEDVESSTLPSGRFYWLAPGKDAGKKYDAAVKHIAAHPERAYCTLYARSSAPAMYRVLAYGNLLALQELAMPETLKERPAVNVPECSDKDLAMMDMLTEDIVCEFDPAKFKDTRKAVIAAALAKANPELAGEGVELATVHQLPAADDNPFLAALRKAGKDPAALEASEATGTVAKKRAPRKATAKKSA